MSSKGLSDQTMTINPTDTVYLDIVKNLGTFVLAAYFQGTQQVTIVSSHEINETIILNFLQMISGWYGIPKEVVTDFSPEYESDSIKNYRDRYHIRHYQTTNFKPGIGNVERALRGVLPGKAKKRTQKEIFTPYKMLLKRMQRIFAADSIDLLEPISGIAHSLKHRILLALENIKIRSLRAKQYFKESQGLLIQLKQMRGLDNPTEIEEYLDIKITLITEILSLLSNINLARKDDLILFVDSDKDGWGLREGRFNTYAESTDNVLLNCSTKTKNELKQVPVCKTCLMV
jgi:hypothetical protein